MTILFLQFLQRKAPLVVPGVPPPSDGHILRCPGGGYRMWTTEGRTSYTRGSVIILLLWPSRGYKSLQF